MRIQKLFNVVVLGGAILGGGCATTGSNTAPAANAPDGGSTGAAVPIAPAPEPTGQGARFW